MGESRSWLLVYFHKAVRLRYFTPPPPLDELNYHHWIKRFTYLLLLYHHFLNCGLPFSAAPKVGFNTTQVGLYADPHKTPCRMIGKSFLGIGDYEDNLTSANPYFVILPLIRLISDIFAVFERFLN